jgi:GalNAc5-diNAcBac-PP-undecaprenol beta-1,3-glucosyltransferase
MNKYPKLSIVIPTYNRSSYLKECLDSIINQNYPNLEIIITDDNSIDDTREVSKKYIKKYPFIKYVKNKKYLQGPNGNKNNGLDYCTGELIAIFDDDDTMVENSLKMMVDKLLEGYDIVIANCKIVSNKYDNGDFSGKGLNESKEIDWRDFFCGKISGEYFSIFKKGILGNKRFDTDLYGGEGTLWRGMLKNRKIYYIHKAVRNYRINNTSVSHKSIEKADIVIKNYERDIEYYGKEMKKYCPCYLATIYKGASYFAKLSSQYKKGFKYLTESIKLCPEYKESYIMFIIMFFPKKIIPYLSNFRVLIKRVLK